MNQLLACESNRVQQVTDLHEPSWSWWVTASQWIKHTRLIPGRLDNKMSNAKGTSNNVAISSQFTSSGFSLLLTRHRAPVNSYYFSDQSNRSSITNKTEAQRARSVRFDCLFVLVDRLTFDKLALNNYLCIEFCRLTPVFSEYTTGCVRALMSTWLICHCLKLAPEGRPWNCPDQLAKCASLIHLLHLSESH